MAEQVEPSAHIDPIDTSHLCAASLAVLPDSPLKAVLTDVVDVTRSSMERVEGGFDNGANPPVGDGTSRLAHV
jgi:hypothetical protein